MDEASKFPNPAAYPVGQQFAVTLKATVRENAYSKYVTYDTDNPINVEPLVEDIPEGTIVKDVDGWTFLKVKPGNEHSFLPLTAKYDLTDSLATAVAGQRAEEIALWSLSDLEEPLEILHKVKVPA